MSKNILIYNPLDGGHYLEYTLHLLEGAKRDSQNIYIFSLPESYIEKGLLKEWMSISNIVFDSIDNAIVTSISSMPIWKQRWIASKDVYYRSLKYKADNIFVLTLMLYFPFLPILALLKGLKISGIIYNIYLYQWKKESLLAKIKDVFFYTLLSKLRSIGRVYMLNDEFSACYLNKKFHTKVFTYLPDPFNDSSYEARDIRENLRIDSDKKIFLMFGKLSSRKGTQLVFDSIRKMNEEECKHIVIIFAGVIDLRDKKQFYSDYQELKYKCQILLYDEFCSYEFIRDLCKTSDFVLVPYSNTSCSSGCIAYADKYGTPVIGPSDGILGKLIRKYRMGIVLKSLTPESLIQVMAGNSIPNLNSGAYVHTHSVNDFYSIIIKEFQ